MIAKRSSKERSAKEGNSICIGIRLLKVDRNIELVSVVAPIICTEACFSSPSPNERKVPLSMKVKSISCPSGGKR